MMVFLLLSVFVLSAKYMNANEYKKKTKTAPHMEKNGVKKSKKFTTKSNPTMPTTGLLGVVK